MINVIIIIITVIRNQNKKETSIETILDLDCKLKCCFLDDASFYGRVF